LTGEPLISAQAGGRDLGDRGRRGLTLLEVLVAIAIVAIAVFPMLQLIEESQHSAFEAKFSNIACSRVRALISQITREVPPGTEGAGDLSEFSTDEGFDERFSFANVQYEWEVQSADLSADLAPSSEEDDPEGGSGAEGRNEDEDLIKEAEEDEKIDDRFRSRYVRITVTYHRPGSEPEEAFVVETYLPPLPKKDDNGLGSRSDNVAPQQ